MHFTDVQTTRQFDQVFDCIHLVQPILIFRNIGLIIVRNYYDGCDVLVYSLFCEAIYGDSFGADGSQLYAVFIDFHANCIYSRQ